MHSDEQISSLLEQCLGSHNHETACQQKNGNTHNAMDGRKSGDDLCRCCCIQRAGSLRSKPSALGRGAVLSS